MDFNELLKPAGLPHDVAVIETIKQTNLPVVLYGASADVAEPIAKKLQQNGLHVRFIAFDDESPVMTGNTQRDATVSYKSQQVQLSQHPASYLKDAALIHVRDIDRQLPAYHVIMGFVKAYSQIAAVSAKFKNARSVAYLSEIFDMEVISPAFVQENKDALRSLYDSFLDQPSKDAFVAFLLSKTRQDMLYLPPVFVKTQYFPPGLFPLTGQESYFDCGAFTGDTIDSFLQATGGAYTRIWAAEPDRTNYKQLLQYIDYKQLTNIEVVNKGIYSYASRLPFQEDGTMLSMITAESEHHIEVDTIDHITAGQPVTYIKMDVEGAELMALKGAEQTIRTFKPLLGISIYHKERDLIDVPAYINYIVPEYQFYFRVHKKLAIDTVLYGVVK